MKKKLIFIICVLSISLSAAAQDADFRQDDIFDDKEAEGPLVADKYADTKVSPGDKVYGHYYHEESTVKIGARNGIWQLDIFRVALLHNNLQVPYFEATIERRFSEIDYNFDFGSYFKLEDGYCRLQAGFGHDITFGSKFRLVGEIEQKLIKNLYININAHYDKKVTGDAYIISPGLIYYFGNHYIFLDYGLSIIEARGPASFAVIKANIQVMDHMSVIGGYSFGQRVYDIYGLKKASAEQGFILFAGVEFKMNDTIAVRVGGSYSEEEPAFIKRSFDVLVKASF